MINIFTKVLSRGLNISLKRLSYIPAHIEVEAIASVYKSVTNLGSWSIEKLLSLMLAPAMSTAITTLLSSFMKTQQLNNFP